MNTTAHKSQHQTIKQTLADERVAVYYPKQHILFVINDDDNTIDLWTEDQLIKEGVFE